MKARCGALVALLALGPVTLDAQQTTSPFTGSVPKGTASAEPLALSVKDAVTRALEHNLGLMLQEESVRVRRAVRACERSADLLPARYGQRRRAPAGAQPRGVRLPGARPDRGSLQRVRRARGLSQPLVDLAGDARRQGGVAQPSRPRRTASARRANWSCWCRSICTSRRLRPRAASMSPARSRRPPTRC